MELAGVRDEGGRAIRIFWSPEGRCFELDARRRSWREVPGAGARPPANQGWRTLAV